MAKASKSDPPVRMALNPMSDSANLPFEANAVSFAVAGDLKVTTVEGDTVIIPSGALAAGQQHSMDIIKIFATGTTATSVVAYG